ncbi:MAG: TRAP transporter small permease [Sneathiella sp.]|nr:TRAP transporter small permease [Sneathiella sp.]
MQKILQITSFIEHALIAIFAGISLIIAVVEMFMRYYFASYLPDWTSEVVIYFITASVMLSGGRLVSENRHVNADFFLRMVPPQNQKYLEIGFCLIGLFLCTIMVGKGIGIVEFAYLLDERSDSSLQFPVFIYYAFVPISFGIMFLHYAAQLVTYIFAFDVETMTTIEVDLDNAD